jgi:DNA-binding SARP family transcriptional activator/tetratricopeptide (TPR) repeat protein
MRFGILGPLLVDDGGGPVSLPPGRLRVLLAVLLLHCSRMVRAEALADVLWDGFPPPSAADTLRTHVMRLRRVLGPEAGLRLVTRPPGYLIEAHEDEVDLLRFTRLSRDGAVAMRAGSWSEASRALTEALTLWRGPALADVPSQALQRDEVPRLDQLRLQAQEWRIDADLHLSRHSDLVTELQSLAAEHPLRERFHAQLMLALYRSGRQAEALAAYQRARAVLVEEIGSEPGSELRRLHKQILTADPALEATRPGTGSTAASPQAPRQLPGPVAQFTGRDTELAALTRLADQAARRASPTVVISAIGGTAGVGKTALAVQWAHQNADRFPDGQLHVNLRGYDPDQPVSAADVLAGFLRALGVGGQDIPATEDERAARYRSLLSGKRVLVLLDNASDVAQVRPLLPGSPGCAVIVTSRDALAGLVARDGATRLDVDLLPPADAENLLQELIGSRAKTEPEVAAELARMCCRLPLALRLAAELAAARPTTPLTDLVAELSDQQQRLDLLDADGDPRTAVRTVFSWSYQHLDPATARAFRLAGLHPGPDLEPYAVAALAETTLDQAREAMIALTRAYLIQPAANGRYGMHDLLRAYARELAARTDGDQEERAALTRLLDYYLHAASVAMDAYYPVERHRRPTVPAPHTPVPGFAGHQEEARAWLDAERANLMVMMTHATSGGWADHATKLATTLYRYLDFSGYYSDGAKLHAQALDAARQRGDRSAEAGALTALGVAVRRLGRYHEAADFQHQALTLYRALGDRVGEGRALGNLGTVEYYLGDYQMSAEHQLQTASLFRELADKASEATALSGLGDAYDRQGHSTSAAAQYRQALALYRQVGDLTGEGRALGNLGIIELNQGRYDAAAGYFLEALELFQKTGSRPNQAIALSQLGIIAQNRGLHDQALDYHHQALVVHTETGNVSGTADALNGIGEVLIAQGRPIEAHADLARALDLAAQIGDKFELARAHKGLGHSGQAAGDDAQARWHWEQAFAIYSELGAPEVEAIRTLLADA